MVHVAQYWFPDSLPLAESAMRGWVQIIWHFPRFPPDFSSYPFGAG